MNKPKQASIATLFWSLPGTDNRYTQGLDHPGNFQKTFKKGLTGESFNLLILLSWGIGFNK
jgi:hypothetical protein